MRRWLSGFSVLLIFLGTAAPLLACIAPANLTATQSRECCKKMGGITMDCPSQAMSCCQVQQSNLPAAVTDRQVSPPPQLLTAQFVPITAHGAISSPAVLQSIIPIFSRPSASVLRI